MKKLCFTGHRPKDLDGTDDYVKEQLEKLIRAAYQKGYRTFISGMAVGVDMYAAQIVLNLKEEFDDIQLLAAIPFPGQAEKFSPKQKNQWMNIVMAADDINIFNPDTSENEKQSWKTVMEMNRAAIARGPWEKYDVFKWLDNRNHWMIDNSDSVLAIWSGKEKGGTANAVRYALKKNKSLVTFNPFNGEIARMNFNKKP